MNFTTEGKRLPIRSFRHAWLTAIVVLVSALSANCSGRDRPQQDAVTGVPAEAATVPQETIVVGATAAATQEPTTVADVKPTSASAPASPTPMVTATAEGGLVPTSVAEPAIDPAVTRSPIGEITQPAYAQSECSDKYPCNDDIAGWESRIRVPAGFEASYFARIDGQPNVLAFGPDGTLYVATMAGEVFTVDSAGTVELYVDGFIAPAGLAFQPGTDRLFISSRVVDTNVGGEAKVAVIEDGIVTDLITGLPCCYVSMHSANGIAFGPDGFGYVAVGARADHGEVLGGPNDGEQDELHRYEASILRFSPDGTQVEVYARGLRNSFDIAWDSEGRLFAADNMPDFGPPEEFNLVEPGGEHGYPWYDCDACFPVPEGISLVPPIHTFVAHSAPTGVVAYNDDEFPGYFDSLFVTLWSAFPEAQRIVWFGPGGEETATFATGFAAPIDLTVGPDGALYVADWATGILFRIATIGE